MKVKSGKLTAAIGASRSGKTQYVTSQIAGADRVLIWDIKGEYPGVGRARNRAELMRLVKRCLGKPGKIAFTPDVISEFDYFCRVAQAWVKSHFLAGENCVLIFEETADVTSPGKAPDAYGTILRRYLSYGVDIYAITQRPAESDKTAVGNASAVRICRLQLSRDKAAASKDTGVPMAAVDVLRADQETGQFDYIQVDTGVGKWHTGRLTFVKNKPVFNDNDDMKPL